MKSLPYMPGHEFHKGYFQHRQVCKAAIAIMGQLQKHYIQHMCKGVENEHRLLIPMRNQCLSPNLHKEQRYQGDGHDLGVP